MMMQRQALEVESNKVPHVPVNSASLKRTEAPQTKITTASLQSEDHDVHSLVLGENDILCGRGVAVHRHIGNIRFRRIIAANKDAYSKCAKNSHKLFMALSIAIAIERQGGRFVRRSDEGKDDILPLIKIHRKDAIAKILQALRDQLQSNSAHRGRRRGATQACSANVAEGSIVDDQNDGDSEGSQNSKDCKEEGDVLPITHRAATQPLMGFSGLMSSFCSRMIDAPLSTQPTTSIDESRQSALRRQLYQQSRPVAAASVSPNEMNDAKPLGNDAIFVPGELQSLMLSDPDVARALHSLLM